VKSTLVYFILGCVSLSLAQESSPGRSQSVNVQRLFKFSGTLTGSHRPGFVVGLVTLRFAMYNEPDGGKAYWQETQKVDADARGRYSVLLGETALGGLPADLFASPGSHWLGVQASDQPEQPRVRLVELPSARTADPISPSTSISEAPEQYNPTERRLALILFIMFLVGTGMACVELRKWWKTRTERYGEPPFANLLRFVPNPDRLRRAAQLLRVPLSDRVRSMGGRSQPSTQSIDIDIDIDNDRPTRAA
jgi:hypothetical protein